MRKRLRKKLGRAEFDVPLLPIAFKMDPDMGLEERNLLLDRFIEEAIEANGLQFGGGGGDVWSGSCEPGGRELQISPKQIEDVRTWLSDQPQIISLRVGPLMKDSELCAQIDRDPHFPIPSDDDF